MLSLSANISGSTPCDVKEYATKRPNVSTIKKTINKIKSASKFIVFFFEEFFRLGFLLTMKKLVLTII
jgi:hypothetical protein